MHKTCAKVATCSGKLLIHWKWSCHIKNSGFRLEGRNILFEKNSTGKAERNHQHDQEKHLPHTKLDTFCPSVYSTVRCENHLGFWWNLNSGETGVPSCALAFEFWAKWTLMCWMVLKVLKFVAYMNNLWSNSSDVNDVNTCNFLTLRMRMKLVPKNPACRWRGWICTALIWSPKKAPLGCHLYRWGTRHQKPFGNVYWDRVADV